MTRGFNPVKTELYENGQKILIFLNWSIYLIFRPFLKKKKKIEIKISICIYVF